MSGEKVISISQCGLLTARCSGAALCHNSQVNTMAGNVRRKHWEPGDHHHHHQHYNNTSHTPHIHIAEQPGDTEYLTSEDLTITILQTGIKVQQYNIDIFLAKCLSIHTTSLHSRTVHISHVILSISNQFLESILFSIPNSD